MRNRRYAPALRTVATGLAAPLGLIALVPATAFAHGLIGRAYLPVPAWLFAWAAGLALVDREHPATLAVLAVVYALDPARRDGLLRDRLWPVSAVNT